jgi:hypothetical protein
LLKQFIFNHRRYPASKGKHVTQGEKSLGCMMKSIKNSKESNQLYPAEIQLFELLSDWTWDIVEPVVPADSTVVRNSTSETEELDTYVRDALENLFEIGYDPKDILQAIKRIYSLD